ncbi:MAG: hypothetical protein H0U21_01020 [Acidimicrobiia bacterium]|nr:hypothetical protein [Acidimicrobiia bacterium]
MIDENGSSSMSSISIATDPLRVDAAELDLRPRPQAVRDSDGSVRHPIAEVRTELHRAILSPATGRETGSVRLREALTEL